MVSLTFGRGDEFKTRKFLDRKPPAVDCLVNSIQMKSVDDFELTKGFTVGSYKALEAARDTRQIAKFIRNRFSGRYIEPLLSVPTGKKSGFCIMAVACLMIEALESFRQGWEDSKGKSETAFCSFFDHFEPFKELRGHGSQFYAHIRCGILHQAETTNGWRIRRELGAPVFDSENLTIGANAFLDALKLSFDAYCSELELADWNADIWRNARSKLAAICKNCERQPAANRKKPSS